MNVEQTAQFKKLTAEYNQTEKKYQAAYASVRKARPNAGILPSLETSTMQALVEFAGRFNDADTSLRARMLDPELRMIAGDLLTARIALDSLQADVLCDELETKTAWSERADAALRYGRLCARIAYLESLLQTLASRPVHTGGQSIFERMERAFVKPLLGSNR